MNTIHRIYHHFMRPPKREPVSLGLVLLGFLPVFAFLLVAYENRSNHIALPTAFIWLITIILNCAELLPVRLLRLVIIIRLSSIVLFIACFAWTLVVYFFY